MSKIFNHPLLPKVSGSRRQVRQRDMLSVTQSTWTLLKEDRRNCRPSIWDANAICSGYAGATSSPMSRSRRAWVSPTAEPLSSEGVSPSDPISRLPADVPAHMALTLSVDVCSGTKPNPDWTHPQGHPRNTWVKQLVVDSGIAAGELW